MKLSHPVATVLLTVSLALAAIPGQAKQSFAQRHPRRAQVLNRDANLNGKINQDLGHLGGHYGQLERQDNSIRNQEQRDARINGGYITKGQQHQLNREESHLNREINHDYAEGPPKGDFAQDHPRRAEVLGRDAHLGQEIANDRGHLSGQYGNLQQDQNNIYSQEQKDARQNGGWITTGQQQHLNGEENQLQNQINQDFSK